jgi:hypothetical protein
VSYRFCTAVTEAEREQVHLLNYEIFVEEIPQHQPNLERRLVDRFHGENTYFQCWRDNELVGMVCTRDRRPFSLDAKLQNLDQLMPPHLHVVEIRLLAVKRNHRTPHVFRGLIRLLSKHCTSHGYDLAVVSAFLGQMELYRHIGFKPFGPIVGIKPTQFQPMYLTADAFAAFVFATDRKA